MAHGLEIVNGEASMFYVREAPWHGLGKRLCEPATAAEAIEAASLSWTVRKVPLFAKHLGTSLRVPGKFAVVRDDRWGESNCPVLGLVGRDYTPLQNNEAFGFFDPIVGRDAAVYRTAGVLGNGERIWILAKLPSDIHVTGDDIARKYLLLSNSHDGKSAVQVKFTPIRVVCQNTLTMALGKGPTIRVAHMRGMKERLAEAERLLGIVNRRFDSIEQTFRDMVKVPMDRGRLGDYLASVFPNPREPRDERARKRVAKLRSWAEHFFAKGKGNEIDGVAGTLWAAYNGVAEFIDHRQTGRQTDDRRLNSVWFGEGYCVKARAYDVAKERMSAWAN